MKKLTAKDLALFLGQKVEKTYADGRVLIGELRDLTLNVYDREVITQLKPFLRPLSDITEEEGLKYNFMCYPGSVHYKEIKRLKSTHQLLFSSEQFTYLLSRGFDLFNWIEQGLAISKPAIAIEADTK